MLRITNVEEIEGMLLRLPALVLEQERSSGAFPRGVAEWLLELEAVLTANRLHQAGSIAALRSAASAAALGSVPSGLLVRGTPTRRRLATMVASHVLQRGAEVAASVIAENRPRLAEAERMAQHVIAVANSSGLVVPREARVENTHYLRTLRRALSANANLESALVHLEGMVGWQDTLVLLDRALRSD